jgi:hypothetical protein
MRRVLVLLAAFIAATAAASGGTSTGLDTQASQARLRLVDTDPVTLRATGFKPSEHVRITAFMKESRIRRAVAGAAGGFTMRFPELNSNACTGFSVTAVGDRGSRATYKRAPGMCPQP